MNYSRRQLEAFGETLGDSVTRMKPGGGRIYGGGGGGAPASQTVTQTTIPEYAKPYVESMLGQASAVTDVNTNPYMQYQGERTAQFMPLQQQAMENAALMATAPQLAQGTALAGQAGLMGLGAAGYRPQSFIDPTKNAAGKTVSEQYMSPYTQNVVDVQQREAERQAKIAMQSQQAQAARAGAFGGARDIIGRGEANRALQTQLAGIQATGQQNAFQQAQAQFNAEQQQQQQARQLGLQGLQTAVQGAQAIGGLGQQQFGQAMDINKLQSAYGGQQQQQVQNILNQQYQDFLNYQNYPYKQLGFMSDILRGVPLTQQSQSIYAAPPSGIQQLGALGMGAYGLSKMADGGMVDSYAEGGSVTSERSVESILDKLSDAQLKQAKQIALAQRDPERVRMIDEELAERASMEQGLGSAFNMLPQEQQQGVLSAAGGGVVAFADGGYNPPDPTPLYAEASRLSGELPAAMYTAPTQEQTAAGIRSQRGLVQEMMGTDKLTPFMEELAAQRKTLKEGGERSKGFAALAAVAPMLEGRGLASIGRGVSKFGSELGRLEKEDRDADRLLMASQVQLATAQQARADGQFDKASNLFGRAEDLKEKGLAAKRDVLGRQAALQATMAGQASTAQSQRYSTDTQAQTSRDVARIQAGVQREGFNKPGETERVMAKIENILTGKESFGGKTGEDGVKLFKQSLGEVGAARMGVGPGNEKPATAPNAAAISSAVSNAMRSDPEAKRITAAMETVELQMSSYARKGKPVPPELNARLKTLQGQKDELRQRFEAEIRSPQSGAPTTTPAAPASASASAANRPRPTLEQFLPAARAANPDASDEQLRAYYQRTYGGQ